ncbi:hypothetical protein N9R04_09985 [Staphylococcus sp. SQ8-PEA]|uniref:DUF4879 domain-containing protein n=1 Tax=Staphylococcus marylandisciuri TaxID=2981529 RepID=A0ABT2QSR0_9STAP|nr:hypothetical protein [Staphylococcus marylandisciuri]MCU5747005.1 hypothetical protein [Staphylococcus marylandisciuri]
MKKLLTTAIISTIAITGLGLSEASANTINNEVKLEQASTYQSSLEGITIGMPIQSVLDNNIKPIYSSSVDGTTHYYKFRKDNGLLVVTADGERNKGLVTGISMSYNDFNGPSFDEVKDSLNSITNMSKSKGANGYWGYIKSGNVSYQFGTKSPEDKNIKLYRIDISK